MARLNVEFRVNLPDTDYESDKNLTPMLDSIAFRTKDEGIIITVEGKESSWWVENGIYHGEFKYVQCTAEGEYDHDWEGLSEKDYSILECSKPYEVHLYLDDIRFKNELVGHALKGNISFGDKSLDFCAERFDIDAYGENNVKMEIENAAFTESKVYSMFEFGAKEAEQYGTLISESLKGRTISKRVNLVYLPGGLVYEAKKLGINEWDLLAALEGMCRQNKAKEIDDSTYKVL